MSNEPKPLSDVALGHARRNPDYRFHTRTWLATIDADRKRLAELDKDDDVVLAENDAFRLEAVGLRKRIAELEGESMDHALSLDIIAKAAVRADEMTQMRLTINALRDDRADLTSSASGEASA